MKSLKNLFASIAVFSICIFMTSCDGSNCITCTDGTISNEYCEEDLDQINATTGQTYYSIEEIRVGLESIGQTCN